jgi:MoaA/NifB/PqqE/SkfB family radical SAM enzyme
LNATLRKAWDLTRLLRYGGPALCNVAITNTCNAACAFCNFARNKGLIGQPRWIDAGRFGDALDILYRRGIRYISLFGGEPMLHPRLAGIVADAVKRDMSPALITNGWFLPDQLDQLAEAGLRTVFVSIDAAAMAAHEANRGLNGLGERIRSATARMPDAGMTAFASVTMSKLIEDYRALVPALRKLGFAAVTFSYPQTAHASTSLVWSDDSDLVRFTPQELIKAFDSIEEVRRLFPVTNPRESIADMQRHLRGEPERFACYGGFKSFYMDWNFDVWRCETWERPMCSVWDFENNPLIRDGCTACIADCYRDSSVMLHSLVAAGDALERLAHGRLLAALSVLATPGIAASMRAVAGNMRVLSRVADLRTRRPN